MDPIIGKIRFTAKTTKVIYVGEKIKFSAHVKPPSPPITPSGYNFAFFS